MLVQQNPQFAHSGPSLPGRQGEGEASLGLGLGLEQARSRSSSQSRVSLDPKEDVGGYFLYICVIVALMVGMWG